MGARGEDADRVVADRVVTYTDLPLFDVESLWPGLAARDAAARDYARGVEGF